MRFPSKLLDVLTTYDSVFLRLALGVTFLAAVSDRFGMWDRQEARTSPGAISNGSRPMRPRSTRGLRRR